MATAIASGIIALVLEANQALTWRDVQHLIVQSAEKKDLQAPDWRLNPMGKWFSRYFGFGLLNAGTMATSAMKWKSVPPQKVCHGKTNDGYSARLS